MKIGFLLGSPAISGGSYVIYEHASRLKRKGHHVSIITRQKVRQEEHAWHSSAAELNWLTVKQARKEQFDVVLATWWETFFWLHQLKTVHYAYFVQSIESRFFDPPNPLNPRNTESLIWKKLCEKTYACAIPVITEAAWIQNYLHQHHNSWPFLVRNGIRKDIYSPEGKTVEPRQPGRLRVLVEGPVEVSFKNVPLSLRLARRAGADEVWLLTSSALQEHPDADRVFSRVPIHETPAIYRSCDVVLKLSYVEGMFGPPLEMFHCGGTALVYDVTGHDEYIVHDQNAYVAATDAEEDVVRLLRQLKENPAELERLKQGAAVTAAAWPDWELCSIQFEQALLAIAAKQPASRKYLSKYTKELYDLLRFSVKAKTCKEFALREKADRQGRPDASGGHNFVRFLWDGKGNFNEKKIQFEHYWSGDWTTLSFTLHTEECPIWLRFVPSVRIGILEISFLLVRNITQNKEIILLHYEEPEEFRDLLLEGDIAWIIPEQKNILLSYGTHPSFILPQIQQEHFCLGDTLEVSLKLRESSIQQFFAEQQQKKKQDEDTQFNTARLHWDGEGHFKRKKSLLQSYRSGEWVEICFELPVAEVPLWLRLDPSRRTGILQFASLVVRNATQDKEILRVAAQEDFRRLFLSGDLKWIFPDRPDIALASGAEPMLILPRVEAEQARPGDQLQLVVRLKEYGVQEFFDSHPLHFAQGSRPVAVSWRERLLRLIRC
ncbi:glycosyltransferase family 4 protein [Candidatus Electronema sp. JM]|uniref:glycosyltransferase family 4 protein n=1 Tax=Candidatus Electronema sp. JM TaxID=3401571 RepID=UPI003AA7FE95